MRIIKPEYDLEVKLTIKHNGEKIDFLSEDISSIDFTATTNGSSYTVQYSKGNESVTSDSIILMQSDLAQMSEGQLLVIVHYQVLNDSFDDGYEDITRTINTDYYLQNNVDSVSSTIYQDVAELKENVESITMDLEDLDEKVDKLEDGFDNLSEKVDDIMVDVDDLKEGYELLDNAIDDLIKLTTKEGYQSSDKNEKTHYFIFKDE